MIDLNTAENRLLSYGQQENAENEGPFGWLAGRMIHGKDWKYRHYHPARYSYRHGLPQNAMGNPMMAEMQNMMMEMMEMRMMQGMMNRMNENSASSDGGCAGSGCSGAHAVEENEMKQYMKDKYGGMDMSNVDMDAFNAKYDKVEQEF